MRTNPKKQNLFLISIHRKSLVNIYQKSIEKSISKRILKTHNIEKVIHNKKDVRVWGLVNTKDNHKIWKNILKSDIVMFLQDKKFFSKSRVIGTIENNDLAKEIWKDVSFLEKRNLLIFLEKIEPIELEYDACISTLIEPNIPNAYFFPIMKICDKKRNMLITAFGNLENAIDFLGNPERKDSSISDDLTEEELSEEVPFIIKTGTNNQRIGQQKFRKNVLQNFRYKRHICI